MTDLSQTIEPKSDQLNSDDLIAGPRTITVTRVTSKPTSRDQPTSIYFEGDNGKPYKPCLTMRRVLVLLWGKDGNAYAGRSMTLYRDTSVTWAGEAVGGIRISHMSHITERAELMLTATKGKRAPHVILPLAIRERVTVEQAIARVIEAGDAEQLDQVAASLRTAEKWSKDDGKRIAAAIEERKQALTVKREPGED